MRLLLDTHTLAWWVLDDPHLSDRARDLLADPDNEIVASAVSAFEMATKHRLGKWDDIGEFVAGFENAMTAEGFQLLSISPAHAILAGRMPGAHRDPFDRLLAAQAEVDAMTLVTNDPRFGEFGSETVW